MVTENVFTYTENISDDMREKVTDRIKLLNKKAENDVKTHDEKITKFISETKNQILDLV